MKKWNLTTVFLIILVFLVFCGLILGDQLNKKEERDMIKHINSLVAKDPQYKHFDIDPNKVVHKDSITQKQADVLIWYLYERK